MCWQLGLALGLGGIALIGIGVVVYVVVKKKNKENPHGCAGPSSNSAEQVEKLVTIGDIIPPGLRKRPTANKSKEEKQNQLNKVISEVNEKSNLTPHEKSAYEKRISNLEKIIAEKDPKIAELEKLISDLQREKQTPLQSAKVEEWLNSTNRFPPTQNATYTEDCVQSVDSVSEDSVETGLSFDSIDSKIKKKPEVDVQKILTWDEMSANAKHNAECVGCERGVETVTSCNHPYMCLQCASNLYPHYKYCTWCDKKLTGYKKLIAV